MLLSPYNGSTTTMNQTHDTGVRQGTYLGRVLQEQHQQHQQKIQQQLLNASNGDDNFNGNWNVNGSINSNSNSNDNGNGNSASTESSSNNSSSSGNNGTISPAMGMPTCMGMGMGMTQQQQQQQNRMIALLQERQQQQQQQIQQQQFLPPTLGISGLSSNIGMDSRLGGGGGGIGAGAVSGLPTSAWMDGFGGCGGGCGGGLGTGTGTEQDILLNSNRYPSLGGSMGGNRIAANGGGNVSLGSPPLTAALGGLSQFSMQHQALTSAQASLNAHHKVNGKSYNDMVLAKQAQAAFLEAAQAQIPRTIRLPCGARGMKADHNSSAAFFDVPETARHGQHLLCSHSVCRAAGVKFRYCFYCKKPVTKQNFRSRHLHANLDPNNVKKDEQVVVIVNIDKEKEKDKAETEQNENQQETDNSTTTTENKALIANISEENFNMKPVVNDDDDKVSIESIPAVSIVINNKEKEGRRSGTEDCLERPPKIRKVVSNSIGETQLCRRRSRWVDLLKERPSDDLEAIHSWTGKVLSVSNPEVDASIWGSSDALEQQPKQQQQQHNCHLDNNSSQGLSGHWNSLLDQRPKGDSNSSSVTKWLIQALEVSDKYKKTIN